MLRSYSENKQEDRRPTCSEHGESTKTSAADLLRIPISTTIKRQWLCHSWMVYTIPFSAEGPSRSRSRLHSSHYSFPLPSYTQDHLQTHQHRDETSSLPSNSASVPLLAAATAAGRESQAASNLPREPPHACETEGSDSRARVDGRDEGDEVDTLRRALKAAEDRALEAETLRAEEEKSRLREEARASALEERVAELEKLLAQQN